jgi:NH3-dependent NAD+ synthetase
MKSTLLDNRVAAIRRAHLDAGLRRAELDLSGGIDSAMMAGLLVLALGPENVTLVHSRFSTNPDQSDRAHQLAKGLDCPLNDIDLTRLYGDLIATMVDCIYNAQFDLRGGADKAEAFCEEIDFRIEQDPTILGSIRSTLRAPIGRAFNRMTGGGLRHGTGNECEDRWLRFYQKGGDGEVDSNPMAMLTKGEVYQLAWFLAKRLPNAAQALIDTIKATPSPDLWGTGDGHSDEAELLSWTGAPFTYSRIDVETGEYSHVGTIERMSRFLDLKISPIIIGDTTNENVLFSPHAEPHWARLVTRAKESGYFDEFGRSEVETFLMAARKTERITRHKVNPNCPTYGTREELVRKGILTNDLPVVD